MTGAEIRELTLDDLRRKATELRENIFNLKLRHAAHTLDSSADLKKNRHDLARVLGELTKKEQKEKKA